MPIAGTEISVYVTTTDTVAGAADEIDGISEVSFESSKDMLDTTDFKDKSGVKTRMAGLEDGTVSLDGHYEKTCAIQKRARQLYESGATGYVTIVWDPTGDAGEKGYRIPVIVESRSIKGSKDGITELSLSMNQNGPKTAV